MVTRFLLKVMSRSSNFYKNSLKIELVLWEIALIAHLCIQKTGGMCEKTGIFKPLCIQLKCRSCFVLNFSSIYDIHDSPGILSFIGNSYGIALVILVSFDIIMQL